MTMGNFNPPPPPSTPKHLPWTDQQMIEGYLYGILQALQPSTPGPVGSGATLDDVLNALNSILSIMKNAPAIQTLDVPVTVPNQQLQFTMLTIPDGCDLVIQSSPENNAAGRILIAPKNGSLQYNIVSLQPGQFAKYRITTTDALYIVGTIVGDIVAFTSEVK
jgi:hypothetical protein